jgi:hypothetical protein
VFAIEQSSTAAAAAGAPWSPVSNVAGLSKQQQIGGDVLGLVQ